MRTTLLSIYYSLNLSKNRVKAFYENSVYTVYIVLVDFNLHLLNSEVFPYLPQIDEI